MWTPSCNIICLSWKRKLAQNDYHTVCPFTINIQTTDIIYFISERQYMLESANYRSKSHLLTNCNFTQVRTVTSETYIYFFTLGSVNLQSSTARTDPSVTVSGVANIPRPNLPCTKAKQLNPDRLYLRNYTFDLAIERLKKKQTETNTTLQLLQNVLLGEEEKWCFPVSPSGDIKMTSMSFFLWFAHLMSSHHFLSTSNTCLYFIICVQLHFI